MSISDFLLLCFMGYIFIQAIKHYEAKERKLPRDLDFNLNDPEAMTKEQRDREIEILIARANRLCQIDRIPGHYVRLGDKAYANLVAMDRANE